MREVIIDVTRLLSRFLKGRLPTGIDRVSLAYIDYFSTRACALVRIGGCSILLSQVASRLLLEQLLRAQSLSSANFKRTVLCLVGQACLQFHNKPRLKNAFLFNTGHSGLEKITYRQHLQQQGVRPLFLVHDLIPITHPEYCRVGELNKHIKRMNNVLTLASGVITNSQDTLDQLVQYAQTTGQIMPPAIAAPLAPAILPLAALERPIEGPYFVILSTIEPRKNHWLLLQIWRRLVETMGARAPKLVVIGQRGWECENVIDLLERCEVLNGVVIELPSCSDADLATYLKYAQALLFPSFAEGYGMPLVEALSAGVPVIASDLPVFREIAGSMPDYLDPLDTRAWIARIQAYSIDNSSIRRTQLERIARFVSPTWASHFKLVEELLEYLQ